MREQEILTWMKESGRVLVWTGKRWRTGMLVEVDSNTFHHIEAFGATPAEAVQEIERKREDFYAARTTLAVHP